HEGLNGTEPCGDARIGWKLRPSLPAIDIRACAHGGVSASRGGETLDQSALQAGLFLPRERGRPGRVAQDLERLDPADVVEEPGAGRQGAKSPTLQFEQFRRSDHGSGVVWIESMR